MRKIWQNWFNYLKSHKHSLSKHKCQFIMIPCMACNGFVEFNVCNEILLQISQAIRNNDKYNLSLGNSRGISFISLSISVFQLTSSAGKFCVNLWRSVWINCFRIQITVYSLSCFLKICGIFDFALNRNRLQFLSCETNFE